MKVNMKLLCIISLLSIFIGFAFIITGFFMGAKLAIYIDKTGMHIANKIEYSVTEKELDTFTNIDISLRYSDIEIIPSDKYGIDIKYYDNEDTIKWEVENDTLKISYIKNSNLSFNTDLSFMKGEFSANTVKVYIPQDISLDKISIKTSSGNINTNGFTSDNTTIDSSFGNITATNITTNNMQINTNSGNISGKNITSNALAVDAKYGNVSLENIGTQTLNISMNSGNLTLNNSELKTLDVKIKYGNIVATNLTSTNTNINANSGDITLNGNFLGNTTIDAKYGEVKFNTKKEKSYYSYNISIKYGNLSIDNQKINETTTYSNNESTTSKNLLKINANSGNVSINFGKN